ncbi:uncharacterized protein N7511_001213 [Penicillium nucicola]|uniref:uncharacterized protein n=1 Tax=Penicillium nucicola TaxID=1850975 RepID=UPI0025457810|nr:uncharacterized protein N7511_001213 [Penicillium nucicola]KAJ5776202.1 hypothetical protein N7511_001213 [Penicillium nucicola]
MLDPETLNSLVAEDHKNALGDVINRFRPDLKPFEDLYRHLHAHPELSGEEEQTAKKAADHLKALGYEVHTKIGGHGVAGVLRNGAGPTILLRGDMDALPVEEQTGLEYSSKVIARDSSGKQQPVMHACGHDTHVTSLMAASTLLHAAREEWTGTLICIFQPAEEHLDGAKAMLDDGLYDKIPKPDLVLAQHVMRMRAGTVNLRAGPLLTAADAYDVRIFGRGGHGSAPQTTIDPIVLGSSIVTRLQSIVSREVTPGKLAVVTVGSIHAGQSHNIIPAHLDLQLNVRTFDAAVRERVCASIHRIIHAECQAAGVEREPEIKLTFSTPSTINDGKTIDSLKETFGPYFGDSMVEMEPPSASEDFSLLATAVGAPYVMWMFGGTDPETWDEAVKKGTQDTLPSNHSPFFAPVIQPTLKTGVDAYALGALTFLRKQ